MISYLFYHYPPCYTGYSLSRLLPKPFGFTDAKVGHRA